MATRGTPSAEGALRGTARHVPVLLPQVLQALAPSAGQSYIDATFGAGGYSEAILAAAPDTRILGLDRDPTAIAAGSSLAARYPGRLTLVAGRFGDLDRIAREASFAPCDGIVLDIGVSSMQLDDPARGFSFQADGPLDMRMAGADGDGPSAADVVNDGRGSPPRRHPLPPRRGAQRPRHRPRHPRRGVASNPSRARPSSPTLVARVLGRERIAGRHAATRTFQALRMYVNDELGELAAGLSAAERVLAPGGRLVVVTFHSLEDRLVKQFLARRAGPPPSGSRHLPPQTADRPAREFPIR